MKRQDVEALVAQASPHDGFRVKDVVVGDEHSLHLVFYVNGVAQSPPWEIGTDAVAGRQVWCKRNLTDADYGDKARLKLALEAACRFLNTCGDWPQLEEAMATLWQMSRGQMKFELCNYHLIDSCVTTEGTYEHVFAADDSPWAVRWVENNFFDVVSLTDIARELREQAEEQSDGTTTTTAGRSDRSQGGRPALPSGGDPQRPQADAPGAGPDVP